MPNPNPKRVTGFQKGKSGNPKGSSAKSRTLGKIAAMTADEVAEVGTLVLEGNRAKLAAIGTDEEASVLKVWMASLIVTSMKKGDPAAFRAILDRICGRPKETVTLGGDANNPLRVERGTLTPEEMAAKADALAAARALAGDD